jgi:hypothetical protein
LLVVDELVVKVHQRGDGTTMVNRAPSGQARCSGAAGADDGNAQRGAQRENAVVDQ